MAGKIRKLLETAADILRAKDKVKTDSVQPFVIDAVSETLEHWKRFYENTTRDDLDKVATSYAFCEGMQNRYWYQRSIREDIIAPSNNEPNARNRDSWNLLRDYQLQWTGMVKSGFPIYRCDPSDPENSKQKETARIVNALFKYHYDYVWNFDIAAITQILPGIFKGSLCYALYYPGKPEGRGAPGKQPKSVIKQMIIPVGQGCPVGDYQTSISECGGFIAEVVMTVSKAMEMFPDSSDKILEYVRKTDKTHVGQMTRMAELLGDYMIEPAKPVKGFTLKSRELIWMLSFASPCDEFPKGRRWLICEDDLVAEDELVGGIIPVEVISTVEKEPGRPIRLPPGYEGVSSQIMFNDILGAMRKKAYIDANPDRYIYENTLISEDGKAYSNDVELGDGKTRTIRINEKLVSLGVRPSDQVPWQDRPTGTGTAPAVLSISRSILQSTMHVNAELGYGEAKAGVSGEQLKEMQSISEQKLNPSQLQLEASISKAWMIAVQLMQAVLDDKDTFTIAEAGKLETFTWKSENMNGGVNHKFTTRIGVPTTKEQKVKWLSTLAQALGIPVAQLFDKEDLMILLDTDGLGISSGRNPEIELSEYENLKIQNSEIDLKAKPDQGVIVNCPVRPEQNDMIHLKVLARLKVGKIWNSLDKDQREAVDRHGSEHIVSKWLKDNRQSGMFGTVPPAELDIMLWKTRGLEIPPQVQEQMKTMGSSYGQFMAEQTQQEQNNGKTQEHPGGNAGKPGGGSTQVPAQG